MKPSDGLNIDPRAPKLRMVLDTLAGGTRDDVARSYGVEPQLVSTLSHMFREQGVSMFELDVAFRSLIENTQDVCIIHGESGTIRYCSPSLKTTLGYEIDDLIGHDLVELIHRDDRVIVKKSAATLIHGADRSETYDVRVKHHDGSWRICEVRDVNLIDHPFVAGIVTNLNDVSEKREIESRLAESQDRYYIAFQSNPDAIAITELATGLYIEVNEGFERITGYSRAEVIGTTGKNAGLWVNPDDRNAFIEKLKRDNVVHESEALTRNKQGSPLTCLASAEIVEIDGIPCMLSTFRDITDQRQAEEVMQRTANRLRKERYDLAEKNIALNQILTHLEEEKAVFREELSSQVDNQLRPLLGSIRGRDQRVDKTLHTFEAALSQLLDDHLDPYRHNLSRLSARQWEICELIKLGMSSKEVATNLNLKLQTVHKHRQVIRKKLGLNNEGTNLAVYLRSQQTMS